MEIVLSTIKKHQYNKGCLVNRYMLTYYNNPKVGLPIGIRLLIKIIEEMFYQ